MLCGVFFRSPIRRKIPGLGGTRGNGPFRQRKHGSANDRRDGTLRACVKFADGFDGVAEKLDANGARRFRRKEIHDAAPLRKLTWHFDHFRACVTDRTEMRDEAAEADFIVGLERAREELVAFGSAMTPKRGGDWRDDEGSLSRSDSEERGGAALENVRVRTARVPGKCVESRKHHNIAR